MIQLPRLLDSSLKEIVRLEPCSLSLELYMNPLSTATMELDENQPMVNAGAFVEIFTASGSAGIFRVQQTARNVGGTRTISLEHGIVTLSDSIIPGKLEKAETTTVRAAVAKLLENQTIWALGTVEIPDTKTISWEYDYSALLDSVLSIMDRFPDYRLTFDQSTTPWKLNIVSVPTETASECRLTRNIVSLSVEEDFSEVCTRLYIPNRATPLEADTIGTWGAITRSLAGDEGLTEDELLAYGQRYLDEHKNPALTVTIDALDLSAATGESMDALHLGYLCRVCLPDYGQTINRRITALSYPDLLSSPESVTVTLANPAENTATTLSSLMVDTTVQRRLIYKNGQELDRLVVRTIANEDAIEIITPKLDILTNETEIHANKILTLSAGVSENGAKITMTEEKLDLQAKEIELQAETISQQGEKIDLHANEILTLSAGVSENGAKITMTEEKLDLQAKEIELQAETISQQGKEIDLHANDILTLRQGVGDNAASITLANGRIDEQAKAIALKADNAALELANGKITANAKTIELKADVTYVDNLVAKKASIADLDSVKANVSNLTSGLTTALVLNANTMNGGQINGTYGNFDSLTHNGTLVSQRTITMGSVSSVGKALSTGALDLQHSHKVVIGDDGTITLGEAAAEGGKFSAATQSWVSSNYIPKANLTTLATQQWVGTNYATKASLDGYQLKTGLTTKTYTVVTNVDYNTATTPPFYNGSGTQVSSGIRYVKGITKTTQDITVVVYA